MCTVAPVDEREPAIQFAFDQGRGRLACVYTEGLWRYGLPELYVRPPERFGAHGDVDWPQVALVCGQALADACQDVVEDGADVPTQVTRAFKGSLVTFTVGGEEVPSGRLALLLPPEVDTVRRVACSLW